MLPQQLRNKSQLGVSEENRQVRTKHQKARLCPAKFLGKSVSDPSFNFFRNLGDLLSSHHRNKWVLWLIVPCFFSGVFLETAANFVLFLNVAMILGEEYSQLRRLKWSLFMTKK